MYIRYYRLTQDVMELKILDILTLNQTKIIQNKQTNYLINVIFTVMKLCNSID